MSSPHLEPQALRSVAEQLVQDLDDKGILWSAEREDYILSLVRQWLTYEAHATLFTREGQLYFTVAPATGSQYTVFRGVSEVRLADSLLDDWKVRREDLLATFHQLNIGQSAEVVNGDGLCLRISVNAQTLTNRIDPVDAEPIPPGSKADYGIIALRAVRHHVGQWLDEADESALASSLARQWQEHEGHGVLFLSDKSLRFKLVRHGDGSSQLVVSPEKSDLISLLHGLGFEPARVPAVICQLNSGQQIPFRDQAGKDCVLWPDSRAGRALVRPMSE